MQKESSLPSDAPTPRFHAKRAKPSRDGGDGSAAGRHRFEGARHPTDVLAGWAPIASSSSSAPISMRRSGGQPGQA